MSQFDRRRRLLNTTTLVAVILKQPVLDWFRRMGAAHIVTLRHIAAKGLRRIQDLFVLRDHLQSGLCAGSMVARTVAASLSSSII